MFTGRLCHWGPITALSVVGTVSVVSQGVWILTTPEWSFSRLLDIEYAVCIFEHFAVLLNYFSAAFVGPGFVPLLWQPSDSALRTCLQFCENCKGYKPPRAHHCRRCGRCVLKLDHHCPWINGCVGHYNHASFVYFLFFCVLACFHSLFHIAPVVYRVIYAEWFYQNEPDKIQLILRLPFWFVIVIFLTCGLAIGVIPTVGSLIITQMRSIIRNTTEIEGYIMGKAERIRAEKDEDGSTDITGQAFVFPYDLGMLANLRQVFTLNGRPYCRGYLDWPLIKGSTHFDLTLEQIRQKKYEQDHVVLFEVKSSYGGAWLPVSSVGIKASICAPWPDEPRLKVVPGDLVNVTRFRRHWVYGELVGQAVCSVNSPGKLKRGWLPLRCARIWKPVENNMQPAPHDSINDNIHAKTD